MTTEPIKDYLKPLTICTYSGRLKLLACWDSLNFESQLEITHYLSDKWYVAEELLEKFLSHENEYIRYLTAKNVRRNYYNSPNTALIKKIEEDKSPLVQSIKFEFGHIEPEEFIRLPQINRIAHASRTYGDIDYNIVCCIEYAIHHNKLPEKEIKEILAELLFYKNPTYSSLKSGETFLKLWLLSKTAPKEIASLISRNIIPDNFYNPIPNYTIDIPNELISQLEESLLEQLFQCRVVLNTGFREKIVFDSNYSQNIKNAAASYYIWISDDKLLDLLLDKKNDSSKETLFALCHSECLTLVQNAALRDFLDQTKDGQNKEEVKKKLYESLEKRIDLIKNSIKERGTIELNYECQYDSEIISTSLYNLARFPKTFHNYEFLKGLKILKVDLSKECQFSMYIKLRREIGSRKYILDEIIEEFPSYITVPDLEETSDITIPVALNLIKKQISNKMIRSTSELTLWQRVFNLEKIVNKIPIYSIFALAIILVYIKNH